MKNLVLPMLLLGFGVSAAHAAEGDPRVLIETSKGNILIELHPDKAPKTVENFLAYVNSGFYNETIFHRVIKGFVIQGGGFTADFTKKETQSPIINEAKNGLSNKRGTLSMARTPDPNSATSQFFVNTNDNPSLDPGGGDPYGYAVFATVIEGMEAVDAIAESKTTFKGRMRDVPADTVMLNKASVVQAE